MVWAWLWMSIKPGATTRPDTSIERVASTSSVPTCTIVESRMATVHTWSRPVSGSMTRPPCKLTSHETVMGHTLERRIGTAKTGRLHTSRGSDVRPTVGRAGVLVQFGMPASVFQVTVFVGSSPYGRRSCDKKTSKNVFHVLDNGA